MAGNEIRNPKHEIRNEFQGSKFKTDFSKRNRLFLAFEFRALNSFRISYFVFRALLPSQKNSPAAVTQPG
jgi:hypothetical protein